MAQRTPVTTWIGRALTVLPLLAFAPSVFFKFQGGPQVTEGMTHLGLPESLVFPLGVVELTCLVLYLVPQTAVLGAILLTGYLGGATCAHARVQESFAAPIIVGVLVWLALLLRERRLWTLLPWRTLPAPGAGPD